MDEAPEGAASAAIAAPAPKSSGPVTVKLAQPITLGNQMIEELTIRAPTGKDFRRLKFEEGYALDATLTLASRLSGQPDPVIDKLGGDDLTRVLEVVAGFMPGGPPTGSAR